MQWIVLWCATFILFSGFLNPGWAQEKAVALEVDLLIDGTGVEPVMSKLPPTPDRWVTLQMTQ
jgi:hypothetical protein